MSREIHQAEKVINDTVNWLAYGKMNWTPVAIIAFVILCYLFLKFVVLKSFKKFIQIRKQVEGKL